MSYNSNVVISCGVNVFNKIKAVWEDQKPDRVAYNNELKLYYMEWDCTKWYDHDPAYFPTVSQIMNIVNEYRKLIVAAEDTDNELSFLRIGEDYSDIEDYSNGCFGSRLSVNIQPTSDYEIGEEIKI